MDDFSSADTEIETRNAPNNEEMKKKLQGIAGGPELIEFINALLNTIHQVAYRERAWFKQLLFTQLQQLKNSLDDNFSEVYQNYDGIQSQLDQISLEHAAKIDEISKKLATIEQVLREIHQAINQ